uniref:Uncharacterized protein n=1 Tax=Poecilia latipinna TaxID=48699 RepID=A0A3B3V4E4_9TELE
MKRVTMLKNWYDLSLLRDFDLGGDDQCRTLEVKVDVKETRLEKSSVFCTNTQLCPE